MQLIVLKTRSTNQLKYLLAVTGAVALSCMLAMVLLLKSNMALKDDIREQSLRIDSLSGANQQLEKKLHLLNKGITGTGSLTLPDSY
jgi:mannitol-specific phosphotransferase system IIBC component